MRKLIQVMFSVLAFSLSFSAMGFQQLRTSDYLMSGKHYHFRQWSNNKQLLVLNTTTNRFSYKYVDDASEAGFFSVYQLLSKSSGETSMLMTASGNPVSIQGKSLKAQAVVAEAGKIAYIIVDHTSSYCLMGIPNPSWMSNDGQNCSRFEAVLMN